MRSASRTRISSARRVADRVAGDPHRDRALGGARARRRRAAALHRRHRLHQGVARPFKPVMALPTHLYFVTSEIGATPYAFGTALVLALLVLGISALALATGGAGRSPHEHALPHAALRQVRSARSRRATSRWYGGVVRAAQRDRRVPAQPRDRDHGTLGLRQVDAAPRAQPHARADSRRARGGRAACCSTGSRSTRRQSRASWMRAHIGMLQQRPTPFPMSIAENVLFGARYHGYARDRAAGVAALPRARRPVGRGEATACTPPALGLSGGQQQRLCLARTLAVQPRSCSWTSRAPRSIRAPPP